MLDDLDGKAGQLEIDATIGGGQTLKIRMDHGGISVNAGTAVITMAIDDGITIVSPNANVTLTANEQTLKRLDHHPR